MQNILFFQSLWAMERRDPDGFERSLEQNVAMIVDASFNGVSAHYTNRHDVALLNDVIKGTGLQIEGMCFPTTVSDIHESLRLAEEFPVKHLNVQPDVQPRTVAECLPIVDGWLDAARSSDVPLFIETHRDRMTTDLFFTLDLLEARPQLPLLADLSHFVVGREIAIPVREETQLRLRRILENAQAFHGRVASSEQVQVEMSFEHNRPWVDLFLEWWGYGIQSWRTRAPEDADLVFTCELGPKPYAIADRNGIDTTDRWQESLLLRGLVQEVWDRIASIR
ncbi:sugar phosphate isomerase/epimerase family protein [Rhizobium sp. NPDC090275]|uniref:sugar phosphate isomerase/epimerase family protein n=1 Tax=Rhizobium sp. NPDC090275 TaxID=3364498 RepID=UPI00383B05AD